ncbi:MAG: hypothetical protein VX869_00385, partial [Chloroflexota bacterium]|nr:hypothetical protein [Chloroflexota bacterium]
TGPTDLPGPADLTGPTDLTGPWIGQEIPIGRREIDPLRENSPQGIISIEENNKAFPRNLSVIDSVH